MNDAAPNLTARRRSGWWLLLWMLLGLLVLTVVTVWWWLRSDGDLRAFTEEMRRLGLSTTMEAWGRQPSAKERIDRAYLIAKKFAAFEVYQDGYYLVGDVSQGKPLPEAMQAHYRALDAVAIAEAENALLAMGPEMVWEAKGTQFYRDWKDFRFLYEHLLMAQAQELPLVMEAYLALLSAKEGGVSGASWEWTKFTDALAYRLRDQRAILLPFAVRISVLGTRLIEQTPHKLLGLILLQRSQIIDPWNMLKELGAPLPAFCEFDLLRESVFRAGREGYLLSQLALYRFIVAHEQPREWLQEITKQQMAMQSHPWQARSLVHGCLAARKWWVMGRIRACLHTRLIAAELTGSPTPTDLLDPAGGPLRLIRRDGRVVAGYSVGEDGVDDGGSRRKDLVFMLEAPIDLSTAPATGTSGGSEVP